jgi:hypothetical protein
MKALRSNCNSVGHLSLAGASHRAVGAASRLGAAVLGTDGRGDLEVLHVDQRLLAGVAAGTSGLGGLVVGGNVEGDEQDQVGADDADTSQGSEFLTGTLAHVGEPGEVGGGEVGVRGEVDEAFKNKSVFYSFEVPERSHLPTSMTN